MDKRYLVYGIVGQIEYFNGTFHVVLIDGEDIEILFTGHYDECLTYLENLEYEYEGSLF